MTRGAKRQEMQAEALSRAASGQSVMNYVAIFEGFAAKGIPMSDILPRENVFTFNAWKAQGRSVKKGEHGVKVVVFISHEAKESPQGELGDAGEQQPRKLFSRRPWATTVFHVSQTEPSR